MPVRTADELVTRMRLIVGNWHLGGRQGNHGDAGNTLEDLLEIPENNLQLPDFGEVEIKTQKYEGGALLTLFHKEPNPKACVPLLCNSLGWRHSEAGQKYPATEMSFRSTTFGHYYSVRGFSIAIQNGRLNFLYDRNQVNRDAPDATGVYENYGQWADSLENRNPHYQNTFPIFHNMADVEQGLVNKLNHTLLVAYTSKVENGYKFYKYEEAYLGRDVNTAMVPALIADGALAVDFDARTGHNHGTKFRIRKDEQHRLFNEYAVME